MDNSVVVVNSTPIILLYKINHLDLLQKLYGRVLIAQAVYQELIADSDDQPFRQDFLLTRRWIEIVEIRNIDAKKLFATSLHAGEVETIILAMEKSADLCVLDDLLARKHARRFELNITGTVGILIAAKKRGFINSVKPLLDSLVAVGMHISEDLYNTALMLEENI